MRALLATLVVAAIAALAAVSSATAAPPNFNAAASLCRAHGGGFDPTPPFQYACVHRGGLGFSDSYFTPARVLCDQVYGGSFFVHSVILGDDFIEFAFCVFEVIP